MAAGKGKKFVKKCEEEEREKTKKYGENEREKSRDIFTTNLIFSCKPIDNFVLDELNLCCLYSVELLTGQRLLPFHCQLGRLVMFKHIGRIVY